MSGGEEIPFDVPDAVLAREPDRRHAAARVRVGGRRDRVRAMGRSILPDVSIPVVSITAPYAGAGPGEVERLVIEPIEDALQGLPGLDRVSAFAQDGIAAVVVRFRFGTNLDVDRQNVQRAVDAARANLPADLVSPAVDKADPSQAPVLDESVSSADPVGRRLVGARRSHDRVRRCAPRRGSARCACPARACRSSSSRRGSGRWRCCARRRWTSFARSPAGTTCSPAAAS